MADFTAVGTVVQISSKQLKDRLAAGLSSVYLLHGKQSVYVDESHRLIQEHAQKAGFNAFRTVHSAAKSGLDGTAWMRQITEQSLFDESLMLTVDWGQQKPHASALKAMSSCLENQSHGETVVCFKCHQKLPLTHAWVKSVTKVGVVVTHTEVSEKEFQVWIEVWLQREGVRYHPGAVNALAQYGRAQVAKVRQLIKWLGISSSDQVVEAEQVWASRHLGEGADALQLAAALLRGERKQAFTLATALLRDVGELILWIWMMRRDLLLLDQIFYLTQQGLREREIMAKLRLWPARMTELQRCAHRLRWEGTDRALHQLAQIESVAKGQMPATVPISVLIRRFCHQLTRTGL